MSDLSPQCSIKADIRRPTPVKLRFMAFVEGFFRAKPRWSGANFGAPPRSEMLGPPFSLPPPAPVVSQKSYQAQVVIA
jgi:hypothetical protein